MKQKYFGAIVLILVVLFVTGCPNDLPIDTVISLTAVSGVTIPVKGATPVTAITETDQYTGTVSWSPAVSSTFAAATTYTATITLTPKTGYTLTGVAADSFTVSGASSVSNSADSGIVTAVFPSTDSVVITSLAISGVTKPVFGATPVTVITETDQYTGSVAWNGSPATFAGATAYTATVTLSPKTGYTLTGITADSFTVSGAETVNNDADSGTITAEFPATLSFALSMATVPAGTFNFDATYTNTISTAYKMSVYETTVDQFTEVTGLSNPSSSFTGVTGGPVQYVNWYHTLVFCNMLSLAEGLTPAYTILSSTDPDLWDGTEDDTVTVPTGSADSDWDAVTCDWDASGYRLPTRMESMWAAMGATSDKISADIVGGVNTGGYAKDFAGSSTVDASYTNIGDYAWYSGNSSSTTHQVGTTIYGNELDLYDMSGNVWEWCWDREESFPTSNQTDYRGASSGANHYGHGGPYSDGPSACSVASFSAATAPNFQGNNVGFRVVRY